ncbi:MAG: amino acid adenylation domain-containing protein [Tatlockia sp.]|jgi:amino acid adenylation domain-containing protein
MTHFDTIQALYEKKTAEMPNEIAVLFNETCLTYSQLNEKANQVAHYLKDLGVIRERAIALCMERSIDVLIAILGILKAGCAYVPLDASHPKSRLFFTLKDNGNPILITQSIFQNQFDNYKGNIVLFDVETGHFNQQKKTNPTPINAPNDLAYIIYTSGSTGTPKGVLIEHKSVANYCHWFANYSQCRAKQRIDFSSNYIFDMAITTSIVPLALGLTVVICPDEVKKDPKSYLQYLRTQTINLIKMTPSYFKLLLEEVKRNPTPLPQLVSITLGGENLLSVDCKKWLGLYPKHILFNEYGPTEATVAVTHFKITKKNIASLPVSTPIGKPGTNMVCYVLHDNLTLCSEGEMGELYIGGACLARGYLNQPKLTQKSFIKSPFGDGLLYKTGDLCLQNPKGFLEFLERLDFQVKVRGFRIDSGEIAQHLIAHPDIEDAVIIVKEFPQQEKRLISYYVSKSGRAVSGKQLREYLRHYLPDYMLPFAFVPVNKFPLTDNGKLDHKALPAPQNEGEEHYHPPSTSIERYLAKVWSNELHINPIGIEDDFLELGGHSLAAARILSEINHHLGDSLTLHDFYHSKTIRHLAELIKNKPIPKDPLHDNLFSSYPASKPFPLSDFQLLLWIASLFERKAKKLNVVYRIRFNGTLHSEALDFAFGAVLKKHETLSYSLKKFRPEQVAQKAVSFSLITKVLDEGCIDREKSLTESVDALTHYYPWPEKRPLLRAALFYWEGASELQICLAHAISDDISLHILLSDLSYFYLHYNRLKKTNIDPDPHYKHYIFLEQLYFKNHFASDTQFWKTYLQDACLFQFPEEEIVYEKAGFSYTTYETIPQNALINLQKMCRINQITVNNGLCAAVALALQHCASSAKNNKPIVMNLIKSTRDNPLYDKTIGCFLRIDPIKIDLNRKTDFIGLAKQIHQAEIDTSLHQRGSNLIKLASIGHFQKKRGVLVKTVTGLLRGVYSLLIPLAKWNRQIIESSANLLPAGLANRFLININVQYDFIESVTHTEPLQLFGLQEQNIFNFPGDLLKIDNFFDLCFQYHANQNSHKLAISANLNPDYRARIAEEIIRTLCTLDCVAEKKGKIF